MPEMLNDLIGELRSIENANDKLRFLIALTAELTEFPESAMNEENRIQGCASNAYLMAECHDGKMHFTGTSDAQIPKGILAMLILGLEEASPQEILQVQPEIFEEAGLKNILSPSRANGAYQIFRRMQEESVKYA